MSGVDETNKIKYWGSKTKSRPKKGDPKKKPKQDQNQRREATKKDGGTETSFCTNLGQ